MSRPLRSAVTFLMGCSIYLGLPVVAWGILDILGFLEHPARLSYVVLVLILNAFAAIRIPEIGKDRPAEQTTLRKQHRAVVLLQILSVAIVLAGPYCDRRDIAVMGDVDSLRAAGLCLYVAGFLLMHFAEAQLGKQFTMEVSIHQGHTLVTDGPYRYIRHPRYLGIMIFSLGLSFVFRSWLGLLCTALTILVLLWRIRDEDELMHREFGNEWEAYAHRTARLVPRFL